MIDEIYDIFDESGNPVGKASWTTCHTQGLIHRAVAIFIFKDATKAEMLLQRRGSNMAQDPGVLAHASGGHVLAGTSPEDAMKQELREELFGGSELPGGLKLMCVAEFLNEDIPQNRELFTLYEAIHPGSFSIDPHELHEILWMPVEQLKVEVQEHQDHFSRSFLNSFTVYYRKKV